MRSKAIQETRSGIIFTGRVIKNGSMVVTVRLFTVSRKKPVGIVKLDFLEGSSSLEGYVDEAFQKWVKKGLFRKTIKDPSLLSILTVAQRERLEETPVEKRAFRFLRVKGSVHQNYPNPRFILTGDKSDLL